MKRSKFVAKWATIWVAVSMTVGFIALVLAQGSGSGGQALLLLLMVIFMPLITVGLLTTMIDTRFQQLQASESD